MSAVGVDAEAQTSGVNDLEVVALPARNAAEHRTEPADADDRLGP